jgi:Fe-S-cluster-containing dehydrogenase component
MCQLACKDEHCGNDWMPYAKPQPETGHFWMKVNEYVGGNVPHVKMSYVPVMCQHCVDAPCIPACPSGAIYARDDGLVIIDPVKCQGRQLCIDACPYKGVISFNHDLGIAQKCTGCAHLLDREWPIKVPHCVENCIQEALLYGEESELKAQIDQAEMLSPDFGPALNTRVYYIGLPKKFIAGTVYDPDTQEVVIGATCTLSGDGTGTTKTDGFGDFWFEGLKVGTFSLKIEAAGKTKEIPNISTEADVGLPDIALAGGSAANPAYIYKAPEPPPPEILPTLEKPILSPDGKVAIDWHEYKEQVIGGMRVVRWIEGRVRNLTASAIGAEVQVKFVDLAGAVVETEKKVVSLAGGQVYPFRVYSLGPSGQEGDESNPAWTGYVYNISVSSV